MYSIVTASDIPYFNDLKVILGRKIMYKCENKEELKKSKTDKKIVFNFGFILDFFWVCTEGGIKFDEKFKDRMFK